MRQVSLREFRTRGVKALKEVPVGETTLLVGQNGPAFFLVPVFGDVVKNLFKNWHMNLRSHMRSQIV